MRCEYKVVRNLALLCAIGFGTSCSGLADLCPPEDWPCLTYAPDYTGPGSCDEPHEAEVGQTVEGSTETFSGSVNQCGGVSIPGNDVTYRYAVQSGETIDIAFTYTASEPVLLYHHESCDTYNEYCHPLNMTEGEDGILRGAVMNTEGHSVLFDATIDSLVSGHGEYTLTMTSRPEGARGPTPEILWP